MLADRLLADRLSFSPSLPSFAMLEISIARPSAVTEKASLSPDGIVDGRSRSSLNSSSMEPPFDGTSASVSLGRTIPSRERSTSVPSVNVNPGFRQRQLPMLPGSLASESANLVPSTMKTRSCRAALVLVILGLVFK